MAEAHVLTVTGMTSLNLRLRSSCGWQQSIEWGFTPEELMAMADEHRVSMSDQNFDDVYLERRLVGPMVADLEAAADMISVTVGWVEWGDDGEGWEELIGRLRAHAQFLRAGERPVMPPPR